MGPKFALHPDFVISASDGQEHFIGVSQLARLYQLRPGEYTVIDWRRPSTWLGQPDGLFHLYPRSDGNYGRPAC